MRAFLGFSRGLRTAFQKAENIALIFRGLSPPVSPRWKLVTGSYDEKTGPGHCSEQQLIPQRSPMINQAREVFCQGRFPASLTYVLIVSPSHAVPQTFMPLPSRNTSAGRPVVLDTALLPCPFSPPSEKETRFKTPASVGPQAGTQVSLRNAHKHW